MKGVRRSDVSQLVSEKGSHIKCRRQLEHLTIEFEQMRKDFQNKLKDVDVSWNGRFHRNFTMTSSCRFVQESREQLDKSRERELRTRSMYENLMSEVQMYQSEVGRLEREVLDEQAKDPVLSQNIRVSDRKRGECLNLLQLSSGRRL